MNKFPNGAKRLNRDFYNRSTLKVAKELLGKVLARQTPQGKISGIITETEAYCGPRDLASHASRGKTERTKTMFGLAGHLYIYLIYGMYYCLNIVTEKENYPAAVLIRSIQPIEGINLMKKYRPKVKKENLADGPGKLCLAFNLSKKQNSLDICNSKEIWVEENRDKIKLSQIIATPRVGVDYAGPYWSKKKWRFLMKNN